ncbi:MAG TPA: flagellar hook-basal body complex protein FliE [Actinobacteria bacterium]|nr:flagellar hook-basal body complex protein FliE [Actinomycetota bacterium]
MNINSLNLLSSASNQAGLNKGGNVSKQTAVDSFQKVFNDAFSKVNNLQKEADEAMVKFAAGEIDIHDVMIQVEKASVALQLTLEIRNKVVEAYQEISRMQV